MEIIVFTFNPFQENTYVVADSEGICSIIDPGMMDESENEILFRNIEERGWKPISIINTHCHIDHILGNYAACEKFGIPLCVPENEVPMLDRAPSASLMWSIPYTASPQPDRLIRGGDKIQIGTLEAEIRDVPGHSPGHVALVFHSSSLVISGDVLFRGSVGRTDLPGANAQLLVQSIQTKMYTLPDDYRVLPGHGPETTIGWEKEHNPFVRVGHSVM